VQSIAAPASFARGTHDPIAVAHGAWIGLERRTVGVFQFVACRQYVDGVGASNVAPRRISLVIAWPT